MTIVEPDHGRNAPVDPVPADGALAATPEERLGNGIDVWRLSWRVSQHRRREFWVGWSLFIVFFTMPAVTGYFLARGFAALSVGDTAVTYRCAVAVAASEMIRMIAIHWGALIWTAAWIHMQTFLRANLLAAQMASGGPEAGRPVSSAGAAITHFRDDTEDVANFVDGLIDVSGGVAFTVFAGVALGAADSRAAAVLLLPLVGVAVATRALDNRIKVYRAADRAATAEVTGLLGDVMAAATTVKVNDATENMIARLRVLVDGRRATAVRDRVLDEGVQAFSQGAADVGLGLVLLVSAGAIASGSFGVGDLALFTVYLGWLAFLPRMIGRVLARRKQAGVAFDRMRGLVAGEDVDNTTRARRLPIGQRDHRRRPPAVRNTRVPLERLDVVGLSALYDSMPGTDVDAGTGTRNSTNVGTAAGVRDVSFTVSRGEFVVITGPVGSGKSTLLRAILGLVPNVTSSGEVRWNGEVIDDRAAFLVPPNAAFLSQVPQLISDSVADNVGLGPVEPEDLAAALDLAAISADIDDMPDGIATLIGPRGLRLSGGQRQRLATARALVHRPELVVLDDLSSALDVETEVELWRNLAEAGMTVLAVSHRAVAFDRADQVITLS